MKFVSLSQVPPTTTVRGVRPALQRVLNPARVRYAEYNHMSMELKVEFDNGDVRHFLNVDRRALADVLGPEPSSSRSE